MKLFRKHREDAAPEEDETIETVCEHVTLIPKWDSAGDIGRADRISSYRCEACGAEFTLPEAQQLRETEAARVRRHIAS
jgi:hypothetical protein